MAPELATASSINLPSFPRRVSLNAMIERSTALLLAVIITLVIGLALLILFHQNFNATKGYKLRSLEYARSQLLLEQELLNMELAKAQSLNVLSTDAQVQAMVKPRSPTYVIGKNGASVGVAQADSSDPDAN